MTSTFLRAGLNRARGRFRYLGMAVSAWGVLRRVLREKPERHYVVDLRPGEGVEVIAREPTPKRRHKG